MTFIITADVYCKLKMYKEQKKCCTAKHKDNKDDLQFTVTNNQKLFKHVEVRTCAPTE